MKNLETFSENQGTRFQLPKRQRKRQASSILQNLKRSLGATGGAITVRCADFPNYNALMFLRLTAGGISMMLWLVSVPIPSLLLERQLGKHSVVHKLHFSRIVATSLTLTNHVNFVPTL